MVRSIVPGCGCSFGCDLDSGVDGSFDMASLAGDTDRWRRQDMVMIQNCAVGLDEVAVVDK